MKFSEQLSLIKASRLVHANWYREKYPEVALANMDPATHYLRYGADMGRDPGKQFNTRFYVESYPEVRKSGLNPLVHFVLHGRKKGYLAKPLQNTADRTVSNATQKLLSLGFTDSPLHELEGIAHGGGSRHARLRAARELALWQMKSKQASGFRDALKYINLARNEGPDLDFRCRLAVSEVLCHYFLGDIEEARKSYETAVLAGETSPDLILTSANLEETPSSRLARINQVLQMQKIPELGLNANSSNSPYDRLTSLYALPAVDNGPKVTVLLAAYEAQATVSTALRSLQEQTWKNLEIIVIDDYSPTLETSEITREFSERDGRIRFLRMERNGGAYIARNAGLDISTGDYVTLHDADDWSHPLKIQTQVEFMEKHKEIYGSLTQQARILSDLSFIRWTGAGQFIIRNVSSFMFRREPMRTKLGYWDTVRFAADSELIRRFQAEWGSEAVQNIPESLLSFQRDTEGSAVADEALGASRASFGVRRQYVETQKLYHENPTSRKYSGDTTNRPFSVPASMVAPKASLQEPTHYDVVIASEFRMYGGSTVSNSQEIACHKKMGLRTAIFPLFRYDFNHFDRAILPEIWDQVDGTNVDIVAYGQKISCDLLILRYPPILQHRQRYIPHVDAKEIKVIINQPPMSDYGPDGVVRYVIKDCVANIRHYFGKDAVWHPIGPMVRDALHTHHKDELRHIELSELDWHNIIDVSEWKRESRSNSDNLRIGRHSRDHEHKWPASKVDIIAAYPERSDVEIRVLGGVKSIEKLIGNIPKNWHVYEFGSIHPKDFLKDLDVWIYFSHPDWLESFGRAIIEAMACGVPVILSEDYRKVFGEAATYATPLTAVRTAEELCSDPVRYAEQVERAINFVQKNCSYEMHFRRVKNSIDASLGERQERVAEVTPSGTEILNAEMANHSNKSMADANQPGENEKTLTDSGSQKIHSALEPNLPKSAGKVSMTEITDLPLIKIGQHSQVSADTTVLMEEVVRGTAINYLWSPKRGAQRLFVIFSGDAQRKKHAPPVFQRWSWASSFPGHCLYVSDPMLPLHPDMGLAWYSGTPELDPLVSIAERVKSMLPSLGLSNEDVCAYGSSGGGFAALRFASLSKGFCAVSINPQTNIARYERKSPDLYARVCLRRKGRDEALKDFPSRMDLLSQVSRLKERNLIVVQNLLDVHHYEEHFKPLCEAMDAPPTENLTRGNFRRIIFSHEGGHIKAESPEVFTLAMNIIEGRFSDDL